MTIDVLRGNRGQKIIWLALSLSVIFCGFARIPHMRVPFERDEGTYAYVSDVIDRGGVPYRDVFDHKPPGIFYLYNLSFRVLGHEAYAPRVMAILFVAAACTFTFLFVYETTRSLWAAVLSTGLLAWSSASPAYAGYGANTEVFVLPFVTGALFILCQGDPCKKRLLGSGLLLGTAFMIKQLAAPIAAATLLACMANADHSRNRRWGLGVSFCWGFIIPFAVVAAYYWLKGSLGPYWIAFYEYNRRYAGTVSFRDAWINLWRSLEFMLSLDPGTWMAMYLGLICFWFKTPEKRYRRLIVFPAAGCFVGICLGGYFTPHYFVTILPSYAMAAGVGCAGLTISNSKNLGKWLVSILLAGSIVIGFRFASRSDTEKLGVVYGDSLFKRSELVGKYLQKRLHVGEKLFVIGSEPELLFYAHVPSSTRFCYFYPLMQPSPYRSQFRSEVISALKNSPPEYFVAVNSINSLSTTGMRYDAFFEEIASILDGYQPVGINLMTSDDILTEVGNTSLGSPPGSIVIYRRQGGRNGLQE